MTARPFWHRPLFAACRSHAKETKSEGVAIPGMDQRGERRSPHRKQTDNWRKSEATEASSSSPGMTRHEDSPTRCPDTDKNNAAPPSGAKKGSCESRKDQHSQTDIAGAREGTQKITRGTMTDDDAIDIQKALAKITALTGMVQAQVMLSLHFFLTRSFYYILSNGYIVTVHDGS